MRALPPVVMIHGMWCQGTVWDTFRQPFEAAGCTVHTPTLRHHAPGAPHPELGTTSLCDYVNDLADFIATLPELPILIGHSMGGLLAQLLTARGLSRATVLLASAAPRGVFPIRLVMLPATTRIFSTPGFWKKPHRLTAWEAHYAVFNLLDAEASAREHATLVHESGKAAAEIVFATFQPDGAATVDFHANQVPLLSLAGGRDRIVPAGICRRNAVLYGGRCQFRVYPQQSHFLIGEPGWERVATDTLAWLKEILRGCAPPARPGMSS